VTFGQYEIGVETVGVFIVVKLITTDAVFIALQLLVMVNVNVIELPTDAGSMV
jgi:hypothetical protein